MAGKSKPKSRTKTAASEVKAASNKSLVESAQEIWLAGIGALTQAREEGTKLFENLVKEGLSLEAATRKIAKDKAREMRGAVESGVDRTRERTQETWDRLEQVFQSRVARALGKLGVPGRVEIDALLQRIDDLNRQIAELNPVAKKTGLARVLTNKVRRARDDFGDLIKDIEEAQLAAKQSVRPPAARVADAIARTRAKPAPAAAPAPKPVPAPKHTPAPAAPKHAPAPKPAPRHAPAPKPAKKADVKKAAKKK